MWFLEYQICDSVSIGWHSSEQDLLRIGWLDNCWNMTVPLYKVRSWESESWDGKWVQLRGASLGWEGGRGARRQCEWRGHRNGRCSSDLVPASLREPGKVVGNDGTMETLCTCASHGDGCRVSARSWGLRGSLPASTSQLTAVNSPRHRVTSLWFQLILLKAVGSWFRKQAPWQY